MLSTWGAVRRAVAGMLRQRALVVCVLLGLALLVSMAPFDRQISELLIQHRWTSFVRFQHHTLFEDGVFGGSDLGLFFQIACSLVALFGGVLAHKLGWVAPRIERMRRFCLFVMLSSVYSGVILVQGLKFAWGRARPYVVFDRDPALYSDWYVFGQLSLFDGRYPGSFPSGHVASSAAFVGLAYVWAGQRKLAAPSWFWSKCAVVAFCFVSWLAMSVARVMGRDHWPTDCLAAGLLVLLSYAFFAELMLTPSNGIVLSADDGWIVPVATWRHLAAIFGFSVLGVLFLWAMREGALAFTAVRTPVTSGWF